MCTNTLKKVIFHCRSQRYKRGTGTKDHLIIDQTIKINVWKDTDGLQECTGMVPQYCSMLWVWDCLWH